MPYLIWTNFATGGELDTVPVRDRNGVTVGTASDKKKVDDDEEDADDYDDDLDLGLGMYIVEILILRLF